MTYIQAIVLGLIQGVTELFPVSSLGHSVVLPGLLGWQMNERDPIFLTFLVATHTATAAVLFFYFLKDWLLIFRGMWSSITGGEAARHDPYGRLGWLLVVATIPAGICGLLFEHLLKNLFAAPQIVGVMLVLNGVLLWCADIMRKKRGGGTEINAAGSDTRIAGCSWI
ncbi:MAG TPA: undecaprenyl-diphosphate phosphatase, partial [Bacteroidota bacterium]|nr:undecaprenyl-diphosphate phosphatase [Bacteroidota bacterium]